MRVYRQLKDERWDALVIGSGIGGLTTGALLSKVAGKKVLILEQHYRAGGYTHTFTRPGYAWDVGLHYIGECGSPNLPIRAAFDYLSGSQLRWHPMPEVYDRAIIGGKGFDFPAGQEAFKRSLLGCFPQEAQGIDRYFQAVHSARSAFHGYIADQTLSHAMSQKVGHSMRGPFARWADRTTLQVLRECTRNEDLIGVLTAQWADYGLPPAQSSFAIHAIIATHYLNGASYPVGGAARIVETLLPSIEQNGGQVVINAEVDEILLEDTKTIGVRMKDGRILQAPVVVSDAGAQNTFRRLIREPQPINDDLKAIASSMAYLTLYIGIKQSASALGLKGTNLWVCPSFDHDANETRFYGDLCEEFPVLYISFPSAKDPEFERRFPGRATIEVVVPVPYDAFTVWEHTRWKKRGDDYERLKQELSTRLLEKVETYVPAIQGKIDYVELSTPLTAKHFMKHERGEAYGLAATPERYRLQALRAHTSVKNLFLTGQDVVAPGVSGALFGGIIAASAILGKNLMPLVTRPQGK